MRALGIPIFLILSWTSVNIAAPIDCYTNLRKEILEYEKQQTFGANLTLNDVEQSANSALMEAKRRELEAAFEKPSLYQPGRNFLEAKDDIEKSDVFKIIRRMPKGAVLHVHDTAMVSADYIYQNITFRDNLYVCNVNGTLSLKFFKKPDEKCNWELLKDVRKDPLRATRVNDKIQEQITMVCKDPSRIYTDVDKAWDKFNKIFAFITPLLTYKPVYVDHFYKGLEELYEDNVMYLELRSTLPDLYDLDGNVYKHREIVGLYQEVTERFKKNHPDFVGVKVIYAPVRRVDTAAAQQYIKNVRELVKEYPNFIAGFDLVGQEDKGRTLQYFSKLLIKVEPNIKFFFHAGETNWYGATTDENLVDALLLNTRRIGHGYGLVYHPFLLEITKMMNIAIEVNPISNQVLGLVHDLRNHAARQLFTEGYPVVISNDDPGLWGARALSYDFYEAFMALMSAHSDLRALKLLAQNSLFYSSMTDEEKNHALALWESKWNTFVKSLATEPR